MLLEYVNSIACAICLMGLLPVSALVDGPTRHPWHALLVVAMAFALYQQIVIPFQPQPKQILWQSALLHSLLALAMVVPRWRRGLWFIIRAELGARDDRRLCGTGGRRLSDAKRALGG